MSEEHVTQVFGPPWIRNYMDALQEREREYARTIISLRRQLRLRYPSAFPDELDGTAWQPIEEPYKP